MQVLIYVVAMEMKMSHKHDNGSNEQFQIDLVPIDQSIKNLTDSFKDPPPPPVPFIAPGLKGIYKYFQSRTLSNKMLMFQKSTEKGMCILFLFQCFAQPMLKCKKMEHILTLTF